MLLPDSGASMTSTLISMAVTIVHPADFAKVASEGGQGRVRLAEALERSGHGHVSDFERRPVL